MTKKTSSNEDTATSVGNAKAYSNFVKIWPGWLEIRYQKSLHEIIIFLFVKISEALKAILNALKTIQAVIAHDDDHPNRAARKKISRTSRPWRFRVNDSSASVAPLDCFASKRDSRGSINKSHRASCCAREKRQPSDHHRDTTIRFD